MTYDFNTIQNRRGSDCTKWDSAPQTKGRDDLLPLWVADMDFSLPPEILEDLQKFVEKGIFGYGFASKAYYDVVTGWFLDHFGWKVESGHIIQTAGVVFALGLALDTFTHPGDAIIIQQPVYYPFARIIEASGRVLVNSPLVYEEGRYTIDFKDFEEKIIQNRPKAFILCSPHNPVGRVWTFEELRELGRLCQRYGVLVISDEIHADFVHQGYIHHPFPTVDATFAENCVVCTAPSKTFNIAGLQIANIVIPNAELRKRYHERCMALGYGGVSTFALKACQVCYTKGSQWLWELKAYLSENIRFLKTYLEDHLPAISLVESEGTYVAWLDCSGLGLSDSDLEDLVVDKAHLWLDSGTLFSPCAGQFQRINLACPRATLTQALHQLQGAVKALPGHQATKDTLGA